MTNDSDRPEDAEEVEVTPEMIEAGALEFAGRDEMFESFEEIVARIYRAMWRVAPTGRLEARRMGLGLEVRESKQEDHRSPNIA